MNDLVTYSVVITGLVQGLGFRPYVAELADELNLGGWVRNSGGIVTVEITGDIKAVEEWLHRLISMQPSGVRIDDVRISERRNVSSSDVNYRSFRIISSDNDNQTVFIAPDIATCDRCIEELNDIHNRRYRYPFISCTACGPRYSIIDRNPYDRCNIRMSVFPMCNRCRIEYKEHGNIRRHAQTIACYDCGPELELHIVEDGEIKNVVCEGMSSYIDKTVEYINSGKIGAVKDIGGYHFVCLPVREAAVRLREYKNRENKPFAIMFPDMDSIREYCLVNPVQEKLLMSPARPIVLLDKIQDFDYEVCGMSEHIGAFLPCNPVQYMICKETGPVIMTSANRGGEPIITDNDIMTDYLAHGFPDYVLSHNRDIIEPLEDSIYQVTALEDGSYITQLIRRARGIVPEPVLINRRLGAEIFAAGGDLKSSFAYGRDNYVYMSTYYGDIENIDSVQRYNNAADRMAELFGITPVVYAADRHPEYYSVKNTYKRAGNQDNIVRIQHHHAHIASVIAEYGLEGKVLGLAFDGTGMGDDGNIWGGELLLCEDGKYTRRASLKPVSMPASDMAAKDASIPALSYLYEAYKDNYISKDMLDDFVNDNSYKSDIITKAIDNNYRITRNSSMGRLFDAVSYITGVCNYNSYEGECAIMLENVARKQLINKCAGNGLMTDSYRYSDINIINQNNDITGNSIIDRYITDVSDEYFMIDSPVIAADILTKVIAGDKNTALYFHELLSCIVVTAVERICAGNIKQIALSGGTWYNQIILRKVIYQLKQRGYEVYVNSKVPSGDGGLALGQVWLAGTTVRKD